MASLLAISRLSSLLTKVALASPLALGPEASVAGLPGTSQGGQTGVDVLKKDVPHGLDGRLRRPASAGVRLTMNQGPRAYAPR